MNMIHSMVPLLFLAWLLVSVSFKFYHVLKRDSVISDITYAKLMSIQRKNPLKRDQALNDATSGQIGEELRPESSTTSNINEQRMKAARKMSRDL